MKQYQSQPQNSIDTQLLAWAICYGVVALTAVAIGATGFALGGTGLSTATLAGAFGGPQQ